jgi:glutaminase
MLDQCEGSTMARNLSQIIDQISGEMARETERGVVAEYIPELAKGDVDRFGLAVLTNEGDLHCAGDCDLPFSVQSVAKVFTLTLALGKVGDALWRRVGREPSGSAFNSIVQLEYEHGVPRNPFINAGALVVTDILLANAQPREAIGATVRFIRSLADDEAIFVDKAVAKSETETGFRNLALAAYLKSYGNLENPVDLVIGTYFHQCAIAMSCRQLAKAGAFLARGGLQHGTGLPIVSGERARRINALMLTCGHYDGSGDFAFRVGIPAKSGVGGGILAIAPGCASIAVWSPGLNRHGNSLLGTLALERLAKATGWSVFGG